MAKKKAKGGGGGEPSKKAEQKKKKQAFEDKTFGLKNKNKSKKVQNYVEGTRKGIMNSGSNQRTRQLEEQRKKLKAENKIRKKAMKAEQDALFGEALQAVAKKGTTSQKSGKIEAQGRDGGADDNKKTTSRAMKMMFQMDAKEMSEKLREDPNYVPTLEDEIEAQRQKKVAELKLSGKGTPVTPETFAAWQQKKREKKMAEAKKKVEAEFKKKKGGKGLAVLTGRDLYSFKQDLFDKVEEEDKDGNAISIPASIAATSDTGSSSKVRADNSVDQIAHAVESDLFLEGDDDDFDDIVDDE